jgi:hypothetical protein
MDTTRRLHATLGLATMFALAACGGTSAVATNAGGPAATIATTAAASSGGGGIGTGVPGEAVDACGLLTDSDIKAATGFSPTRHAGGAQLGIYQFGCEWELDNEGAVPWSIVVGATRPGGRDYYDRYFAPPVGEGDVLQNVGDDAIQDDTGLVNAVKGDTVFTVSYIEFPARNQVAVELAKAIAAKL